MYLEVKAFAMTNAQSCAFQEYANRTFFLLAIHERQTPLLKQFMLLLNKV